MRGKELETTVASDEHQHHGHAHEDKQRVADGIRHGIAHGRQRALQGVLNRAKRCRSGSRPGAASEIYGGVEFEDFRPEEHGDEQGHRSSGNTHQEEVEAHLLDARDKRRSALDTDYGDKHVEAEIVHQPQRRTRNDSRRGMLRAQPAEEQTGDKRTARRGKADRNIPYRQRNGADKRADCDAEANKYHIGYVGGFLYNTDRRAGKFHLLGKAHDFKHIAGLKLLLGIDSHRHFRTAERLDGNAIHERLGAQLIDGQAGSFFVTSTFTCSALKVSS